ncbi:hypothetical protein K458DRAFT_411703 [Lentithecium fluviatile CBS 122367]|uniref:DUF7730 domain-containing protein n=1 Tax=Lentithecium fluviatile CBS 122367 TaxID=1168545 RepID=A0A6G1JP53_9PLEO|nr:hypothetical protein K458DRAFT_411703 [Lentithecium fluviatile CBS 122367]
MNPVTPATPRPPLFLTPSEIRLAIYAYLMPSQIHIFSHKNALRLSACIQQPKDEVDPNCCSRMTLKERENHVHYAPPDPMYTRRLASSWGTHWRCEEAAKWGRGEDAWKQKEGGCNEDIMPLLLTCRQMFSEVIAILADTTALHITDLDTFAVLAPSPSSDDLEAGNFFMSSLLTCMLPSLKELRISLKLPLEVYALFESGTQPSSSSSSAINNPVTAWANLPSILNTLPNLRRLHIRLDHTEPDTWTRVNEHVALSPVASLAARSHAKLDIAVDLPKLHPKYEEPARHFIEDSPAPPFPIQRRIRQRIHADIHANKIFHKDDFPFTHEMNDFLIEWNGMTVPNDMSYSEFAQYQEDQERNAWKEGRDPYQEMKDEQKYVLPNLFIFAASTNDVLKLD